MKFNGSILDGTFRIQFSNLFRAFPTPFQDISRDLGFQYFRSSWLLKWLEGSLSRISRWYFSGFKQFNQFQGFQPRLIIEYKKGTLSSLPKKEWIQNAWCYKTLNYKTFNVTKIPHFLWKKTVMFVLFSRKFATFLLKSVFRSLSLRLEVQIHFIYII